MQSTRFVLVNLDRCVLQATVSPVQAIAVLRAVEERESITMSKLGGGDAGRQSVTLQQFHKAMRALAVKHLKVGFPALD